MLTKSQELKGTFYILISSFFFGTYGLWARLIGSSLDNLYQIWVRCLIILIFLIPIAFFGKKFKKVRRQDIKWILLYAGAATFTVAPIFYAFNVIGIGPAILLFYASLVISSYFAGFVSFGEKLTVVKVVALLLSFAGLLLIYNLSINPGAYLAAIAAIISGLAGGIEVSYTKKISNYYSPEQVSIFGWGTVLITHLILSFIIGEHWIPFSLTIPWFAVLGFALSALTAYYLVIIGFKYAEPSIGSIVGLLEIIFGIIFGVVFFHEGLTTTIILGSALIIIAAVLPNLKDLLYSRRN